MKLFKPIYVALFIFFIQSYALTQDFSGLKNLDNSTATFESKSNTRLVYFWATWCSHCQKHVKNILPKLEKQFKNKKIDILTVAMDKDLEPVTQYTQHENITLKVFRDPEKKLSGPLKISSVPTWAIFERQNQGWKLTVMGTGSDDIKMLKALDKKR